MTEDTECTVLAVGEQVETGLEVGMIVRMVDEVSSIPFIEYMEQGVKRKVPNPNSRLFLLEDPKTSDKPLEQLITMLVWENEIVAATGEWDERIDIVTPEEITSSIPKIKPVYQ